MLSVTATEIPRLMRCIGSRQMPAALPADHNTEARDEGNAADWLAERLFDGAVVPVGAKAPNGWAITDDMLEHVRSYLDALDCGEMQSVTTFSGETWEVRGRADHIKYRDGVLTVDDLKYGWRIVEPDENWTLIAHAIGWSRQNDCKIDRVVLRIIQPRPYHKHGPVREWSFDGNQLALFYRDIDTRLFSPSDELVTGIQQCAKCHALAVCPAARSASMNAIDVVESMAFSDDLPNDILAHEYEVLDQAESMVKAVRDARAELMTYRIQSGQVITGYALQQRNGQRAWMAGMSGRALSAAAGVDLTKDGVVTPAEAERRGVPKQVVASLTNRPVIGVKLDRIDADATARKYFNTGA